MDTRTANLNFGAATAGIRDDDEARSVVADMWWLWLVSGIAWVTAALLILQFDRASLTTIGIIVGAMFMFTAVQLFIVAAITDSMRWLSVLFGVFFLIAGLVAFFNPEETFAGFADILGFLFLMVGVWWMIRAFVEREDNPVWWLGVISGVLMVILAFWTSGQFFIEKAYTLLVFAGIWALMNGIGDIIRAFQARSLR